MTKILSVQNFEVHYKKNSLFKPLSFEVNKGEILWIRGDNGAGKTSLLRALTKQINSFSGSYKWHCKFSQIVYVSQMHDSQFFLPLSLKDIVGDYSEISGLSSKFWNTASGGERQLAILESAFLQNKGVYLLDEPFNHLDRDKKELIWQKIRRLSDSGLSFLIVSHEDSNYSTNYHSIIDLEAKNV